MEMTPIILGVDFVLISAAAGLVGAGLDAGVAAFACATSAAGDLVAFTSLVALVDFGVFAGVSFLAAGDLEVAGDLTGFAGDALLTLAGDLLGRGGISDLQYDAVGRKYLSAAAEAARETSEGHRFLGSPVGCTTSTNEMKASVACRRARVHGGLALKKKTTAL